VVERLWAYTVAYVNIIQVAERVERGRTVGAEQRTQVQDSLHILTWALRNELIGKQTAWPPNLYPPREDYPPGSLAHKAVVLFQVMVGWMPLHELGHVVHRHPGGFQPPAVSKKQELDADDWAFEWVFGARRFGRTARDRAVFVTRTTGVTFALAVIAGFEAYDRRKGGITHPDPVERLDRFLRRYVPRPSSRVSRQRSFAWFVAAVILQTHLRLARGKKPLLTVSVNDFFGRLPRSLDEAAAAWAKAAGR
jgi:hypothetical protein